MITILLPANMQEIIASGKYLEVIKLLNKSYKNESDARWEMLKMLCDLDGFEIGKQLGAATPKQRRAIAERISDEDALEIAEQCFPALDFIFNNEPFYANPIPTFEHKGISYQGPDNKLLNQTGAEWTISHHAQVAYHGSKQRKHLCDLIAANYHPVVDGIRTTFENSKIDTKDFETLPDEIVNGIYIWYLHCENWWGEKYNVLYDDEVSKKKAKGKEVWDLIFELSGCELGSNYDRVQTRSRQEIFMALSKLEEKRIEAELKE